MKDQIINAVEELPQDVSIEDVIKRLYLLYKIERGIEQATAGKTISQEVAKNMTRTKS